MEAKRTKARYLAGTEHDGMLECHDVDEHTTHESFLVYRFSGMKTARVIIGLMQLLLGE